MEIRPVGAELLHADGQTDEETRLKVLLFTLFRSTFPFFRECNSTIKDNSLYLGLFIIPSF